MVLQYDSTILSKKELLGKVSTVFFSVFHSVSNFVGFLLVKALPIGTSVPTVRSYTLSYTVLAFRARVGARVEVKRMIEEWFQKKILSIKLVSGPRFRQWFTQIF